MESAADFFSFVGGVVKVRAPLEIGISVPEALVAAAARTDCAVVEEGVVAGVPVGAVAFVVSAVRAFEVEVEVEEMAGAMAMEGSASAAVDPARDVEGVVIA